MLLPPLRKTPLLLALLWPTLASAAVHDLGVLRWTLTNQNGSIAVPGHVPSQAHLDLAAAGVITEPLLGINDFTQRWVWLDNWTYTADLAPVLEDRAVRAADQVLLVFHGLDTIANITVADQPVAWVDNEFQQYVFDVSFVRSVAAGNLTVAFESAYYYGVNISRRSDTSSLHGGQSAVMFRLGCISHCTRHRAVTCGVIFLLILV